MGRRTELTGICGGCGEVWPCRSPSFYPPYWALDMILDAETEAGMVFAVAVALGETREQAIQTVGQAAQWEGKSFQESLNAYFYLYTDGSCPSVEPYRGRVPSRGVPTERG